MTAILRNLLSSRKLLLGGGAALLLSVATSAAAILIGKDRLLGLSYGAANGFACESAQTVNISKSGATWIRKYIRMGNADGAERVKTALRVASVVYAQYHPDLIQITVLDEDGPELRSNMRGRAIAAQIVFIPNPAAFPEDTGVQRFSGYYHEGAANPDGQYYGLRIDLPYEDIEQLALAQDYFVDCKNPDEQSLTGEQANQDQLKSIPGNLGQILPDTKSPATKSAPGIGDEEQGEALKDLLTSTPEVKSESYFSLSFWKTLLFGKGASVAEAAVQSAD